MAAEIPLRQMHITGEEIQQLRYEPGQFIRLLQQDFAEVS